VSRVAVVGLGDMGSRIAAQLLSAGHGVVVWNRTPDKAGPLVELGAKHAATPADAARGARGTVEQMRLVNALCRFFEVADDRAP
jgi:3-hydroxyisobutyrate dehydrogenase